MQFYNPFLLKISHHPSRGFDFQGDRPCLGMLRCVRTLRFREKISPLVRPKIRLTRTQWGHAVAQLFEALRKVADSIFHSLNPSSRTMALGSTHSITELSTRGIPWGVKAAGA